MANSLVSSVSVIDARLGSTEETVTVGAGPLAVSVSHDGKQVYVLSDGEINGPGTLPEGPGTVSVLRRS